MNCFEVTGFNSRLWYFLSYRLTCNRKSRGATNNNVNNGSTVFMSLRHQRQNQEPELEHLKWNRAKYIKQTVAYGTFNFVKIK